MSTTGTKNSIKLDFKTDRFGFEVGTIQIKSSKFSNLSGLFPTISVSDSMAGKYYICGETKFPVMYGPHLADIKMDHIFGCLKDKYQDEMGRDAFVFTTKEKALEWANNISNK